MNLIESRTMNTRAQDIVNQKPNLKPSEYGRSRGMSIYLRHSDIRDITRRYFEHPIWRLEEKYEFPDMPLDIQLELINKCNLSCPACVINYANRKISILKWNTLKKIVDESARESVCYFTICGVGEAALSPYLFPLLGYIRRKKVEVKGLRQLNMLPSVLISNGIWSERQVNMCLQNPPDLVSFSLSGLTNKDICERRYPINLNRFRENVTRLFTSRKIRREIDGAILPIIHISTHIYPFEITERKKEVEHFIRNWLSISDAVVIKPTMINNKINKFENFLNSKFSNLQYINISENHYERTKPCFETSRRLSINSSGNVWCGHHNSEDSGSFLGNIEENTIREIWHGKKMQKFREEVRNGKFNNALCKKCGGEIREN
jgi:radical SAM protein with 4Fe4S-binding SPASM domain